MEPGIGTYGSLGSLVSGLGQLPIDRMRLLIRIQWTFRHSRCHELTRRHVHGRENGPQTLEKEKA